MHDITTPELIALLTPFVGAKLRREYRAAIDIRIPGSAMLGSDIRGLTDTALERFFYDGCETIQLADITAVTVHALDAEGNRIATVRYRHVPELAVAA